MYRRSSELLLYNAHTKAIALALSPPEYAKNMHENLDELCSGIDVPARTASLETSEEVSSWIASLVCAQNKGVKEMNGDLPFGFSKQDDELRL